MKFPRVAGSPASALVLAAFFSSACSRHPGLPDPRSPPYREAVTAFSVGVAALQSGDDIRAQEKLRLATQLAPGEPASWANLGLLSARQQDFDAAYSNVEHARSLMPEDSPIEALLGLIEDRRGKLPEAIGHLQKAVQLNPNNAKAQFSLAEETEREAKPSSDSDAEKVFAKLLEQRPENVAVLLEVARLAAKTGDGNTLQSAVAKLSRASASWPAEVKEQMNLLQQAAAGSNPRPAAVRVMYLRNTLARVPDYRKSLNEVKTPTTFVSDPFVRFLKLPPPASEPAAADLALQFETKPIEATPAGPVLWVGAIPLDDQGAASILWANQSSVQIVGGATLRFPGGSGKTIGRNAILGADLNYDFRTDLVFAGAGGLAFYEQQDLNHFTDITERTHLPANILHGSYTGAWAFDVDLDGDLDIVLGTSAGEPIVLRNNGDETFAVIHPFAGVNGLTGFASADIDGDGDPDAAILDKDGALHVFANERLGQYRPRSLPQSLKGRFLAVVAADINNDGLLDFVLLRDDGTVVRLSDKDEGRSWDTADIVKADPGGSPTLVAADFDNNGSLDLLVGDGQIFLGGDGHFKKVASSVVSPSAVDLNSDGRLDLVGLDSGGRPVELLNHGSKNYSWQNIRLRAAKASGDQRINSFGIGGEIEVRAGLLTQKQAITSQLVHFGLGDSTHVDVARITWPNGVVQGEFELKADQEILATQRLKGSCPWLFAWDGKQMSFVKDGAPWSSALGLHINAQVVAGIYQTEEWFKIPGESLKPRDGFYDLRITDELWETYYVDHYSLMVVDHPEGTEIYTDERFAVPPPPLKIYTTSEPQPFLSARDDRGADVSATVRDVDRQYLDTFGRGPYQGLTRDHWVELELPAAAPQNAPLYLLATGWTHPTDATVNIAIGQNSIPQPQGLSIEVPDANGKWTAVKRNLGFPAGKMKTVVLDLTGLFQPGAPRKLRLRTNLEIYWDQLAWAVAAPDRNRVAHLALSGAELRYRGFSQVKAANPSSPELPDYNKIASSGPIWRDLEGYATRFGDIRELLEKIDGRMVIVNAGDEVALRFRAPDAIPAGWKRDFIMIGDGWIKDGDFNSVYSKTVLPLPYHGMKNYDAPPRTLEDDPAYKRHPEDWLTFHTRYVTPEIFENALRN
jgi:tetratricopeptide (TPR) repeat protein